MMQLRWRFFLRLAFSAFLVWIGLQTGHAVEMPETAPQPMPISVALSVLDIQGIRENVSTLFATIELRVTWRDPRLAFDPIQKGMDHIAMVDTEARKFLDEHWNPRVGPTNLISTTGTPGLGVILRPDGTITSIRTLTGGFYVKSDFTDFPFDQQAFAIDIASDRYNRSHLILVHGPGERKESAIDPSVRQSQWTLTGLDAVKSELRGWDGTGFDHLAIRLLATRKTMQYAPQIFMPYFFIMMAPMILLLIRTDNHLQKVTMLSGASLAMIALQFTLAASFPDAVLTDNVISRMLWHGYTFLVIMLLLLVTLLNTSMKIFKDIYVAEEVRGQLSWAPATIYLLVLAGNILTPLLKHLLA